MASEPRAHALSNDLSPAVPEAFADVQAPSAFRPDQVERALFEIQSEQRPLVGAVAGGIAGMIGAIVWAAVTVVMMVQIGWLAIGIGAMVGAAVRWAGRGTTRTFGVIGGGLALASVVIGNFLSLLGIGAGAMEVSYLDMITMFDYSQSLALMADAFSPMDLVFYAFAIWTGYQFSFREVTEEEIHGRLSAEGMAPAR